MTMTLLRKIQNLCLTSCMHVAHIDIMFICPRASIVNIGERQNDTTYNKEQETTNTKNKQK